MSIMAYQNFRGSTQKIKCTTIEDKENHQLFTFNKLKIENACHYK